MDAEAKQDTSLWLNLENLWTILLIHVVYILAAVMGVLILISLTMIGIAWLFGARFDVAINELIKGNLQKPSGPAVETLVEKYDRGEL